MNIEADYFLDLPQPTTVINMTEFIIANGAVPTEFISDAHGSIASTSVSITEDPPTGFFPQHIHIDAGIITTLSGHILPESGRVFDATGCIVLPGFIDIHVHGAMGHDTMDTAGKASVGEGAIAFSEMSRFFATHGVTSFFPTTMTAPPAQIASAIRSVGEAMRKMNGGPLTGAKLVGAHVEGPFISAHFPGAQPAYYIRQPDLAEFKQMCSAGPVRMITLAPEEPGALELIAAAAHHGIASVVGHTNATFEECQLAFDAGATQATHTYNAMSGLHHRNPGTLGAVLSDDRIYAQLIADNIHVHPAAMKILARSKGIERTVLITDAMRAAGLPPGNYDLGGQQVAVQNGECRLADGTLAGSILTMEEGLANFIEATKIPLKDAWPTSSRTPAQALGLDHEIGSLSAGYRADLVVLDSSLAVVATIVDGRVVYLHEQHQHRI